MKMARTILTMAAVLAATVGYAGDSSPFRLDTSTSPVGDSISISWDASWIGGNANATVVIEDNGTIVTNTTGAGEFTHTLTGDGRHDLTYTTYIGGVAQDEVYKTVVYKGKYIVHFESNGGEGAMEDCEFVIDMPSALPQGAFTKDGYFLLGWSLTPDGEATLFDGDSTADIVADEGETVTLYAVWHEGEGSSAIALLHRWSFNEDMNDSVGGCTAVSVGSGGGGYSWTSDGKSISLQGGSFGTSGINLGANLLPTDGTPVTFEFWAKNRAQRSWSRLFDVGSSSGDVGAALLLAWSSHSSGYPALYAYKGYGNTVVAVDNVLSPCDFDREYHISVVIEPNRDGDGCAVFTVSKRDGLTGAVIESLVSKSPSAWTIADIQQNEFYLGRSHWSADQDASCDYNEVRIWKSVLTESQLAANAQNGADADLFITYAIQFDANGGNGSMPKRVYATDDDVILPDGEFTRDGWTLVGWAVEPEGPAIYPAEGSIEGGIGAANRQTVTLYAQWKVNQYTVTFNTAGGVVDGEDGALGTTRPVTYDSVYGELPTATRVGYTFDGWILGDTVVTSNTVVKTAEDHTLVARWVANEYEVTFDAAGGVVDGEDGALGTTRPVTYDSVYGELPTASCEGYVFLGWTLNGADVTAESVVKTADDHTLTAKWGIQVGNGIWPATVCDEPITLGAPLVAPSGEVEILAMFAGRPVVGITAEAFAGNDAVTAVTVRLAVEGVDEGLLPDVPLCVIVENDDQVIPDAIAANVRKVVFADGVTRIEDNWFTCGAMGSSRPAGCPNLETFDIADSVVRIGTNVFEAASVLEPSVQNGLKIYQGWCLGFAEAGVDPAGRMTLPDGLRGIAAGSFEGEYSIESVAFPSTLRFVGAGAFKDCTGLEDIDLPEGVVVVDREAFRNCTYAQSLALPATLEEIGAGAFANATSLAGVTVPDGVADIGECAFSNCWRMMSATIPASVTNVGAGAFADCRRLTGVSVPLGLGTMAELFPAAYDKITSVMVAERRDGAVSLKPPRMDAGMFAGCAAMTDLTLPEGLGEIADEAFVGCASMAAFDLSESVTNIGARAFTGLSQLTAFEFPAGLVAIGASAFSGCSGITELTLPDGLESIDASAFQGLTQLSRVDIPASVTEIGYGAFGGCERLRSVSLPGDVATVAEIMPDAYRQITSAAVTESLEIAPYQIIDSLFEGCEALAVVELPSSVTGIGARAFAGCTSLTDAGIPSGVTSLGDEVFSGCANLSAVSLPKGLSALSSRMFEGCASLNEVIVPEGVATLGANVFNGCSSLRTVAYIGNAPAYNAAAYAGVPASLVTKVVNGSTGWDGIATSKALPEFWPAGTSNEITFWEPNRFMVDFVAAGEGVVVTQSVEQVTGTTYMLPADAVRRGAVFGGWWTATDSGARVTASTQVVLTRPHTFYAHWTFNRYSVHFDANGGVGEMAPQGMTVNTADSLAECGFSRAGYAFVGWATEPDGEAVYADAAEVMDLAYAQNAAVTLYAVWEERDWTLADYVDAEHLTLENDEAAAWTPDWTVFKSGGVSLKSGAVSAAEEGDRTFTTLTASVLGEGTGSFWWKVSCEDMDEEYDEWYDYAVFTIDGVEIAKIAGETDWEQVEFAVTGAGTHTLAWTFTRDDYDEDETAYENAAWVDGVVWTPKPVTVTFADGGAAEGETPPAVEKYQGYEFELPGAGTLANGAYQFVGWSDGETVYAAGSIYVFSSVDVTLTAVWELKVWTFGEAVDAEMLSFTTGGEADWSVDASVGCTNSVSAKSGVVADGQSSWIEATVSGAGTLVFRWNVMGGIYRNKPFAYAKVEVDGEEQAQEHNTESWKEQTVNVEGTGTHTIRWTYLRTSGRDADGDCAWLDAVSWTPNEVANVAVDGEKGKIAETADGYVVTAKEGKVLTEADFAFGTVPKEAYKIEIAEGGRSATVTLAVPVVGVAPEAADETHKDEDDPSGMLVGVALAKIAAKPEPKSGETVGALPVKAYEGLYYQAAWGSDITGMTTGEKVKATGRSLYLGVIKQKGEKGFYKLTVSEK